jgi:hypothetical protein
VSSGRQLAVVAVRVAVAVSVLFGAVYFVKALSDLDGRARANSELSFGDREIAGGNAILVSQDDAYDARSLIPPRATYRVRAGPRLRNAKPLTSTYVESWYRYFLMPRRPAQNARWIICYGCDASGLGPSFENLWHDDNGVSIGRLR